MEITLKKPIILKAKCPVCGCNINTSDFSIERESSMASGRHIFNCLECSVNLTMSPNLYKYINLFFTYFSIIVLGGLASSFFVSEPMDVTLAMLFTSIGFIPLIILIAKNKKAIKSVVSTDC